MIAIISTFEGTPIVPAHSGGVYDVDGGTPLTLSAVNLHGSATYEWELGDGATATGPSVNHTYADNGVYVAKLTVVVGEPGGARSRHFATVRVHNVPPTVDAGGDVTVDEGEVVPFTGTFTDPEWPDTHEAVWYWGDHQSPTVGEVSESNDPPASTGTVQGEHAWCDDGVYTVTLRVRDDDGGVGEDTLEVTVLNVPPSVDAGPDLFAYPCTVITLVGEFVDPGWCDTHVATWAFGDCTPPHPALIDETHEPPAGRGTATASHVYDHCGTYHVVCTVTDDDGGVGEDSAVISVVDVENAGFEDGFRPRSPGAVANGWEPYAAKSSVVDEEKAGKEAGEAEGAAAPTRPFACEQCLVHSGQRSQRIRATRGSRVGVLQRVGANPGWDYQVSAWYALDERGGGVARLGIDPAGGSDPDAPGVAWAAGDDHREWRQLVARVTATGDERRITIFLETDAAGDGGEGVFDDVELVPIQPFCPPDEPEVPPGTEERCVDFDALGPRSKQKADFMHDGFRFRSADGQPQYVVPFGDPSGVGKLAFRVTGVLVTLPFTARRVRVDVATGSSVPAKAVALDAQGQELATADEPPFVLDAEGIAHVLVAGGGGEAWLVSVCAEREKDGDGAETPRPPKRPAKRPTGKRAAVRAPRGRRR